VSATPVIRWRWPWVLGGVLLVIVVAIGACEAAGWPFLVGPAQRWLSGALERRIVVGGAADGNARVRIGLLGSVRVTAPMIEKGAPPWSDAPHMVLAHNARLVLGYGDLWRAYRGEPLHIRELHADDLDARIERLADGRASWQFGKPKPVEPDKPSRLPSFGDLKVGEGTLAYQDAILEADAEARFALKDRSGSAAGSTGAGGSASAPSVAAASSPRASGAASAPAVGASGPAGSGLELEATGRYRKLPLKIELTTSGVLQLTGPDADKVTQPVRLLATIGRARVTFDGVASDALHLSGLKGRFDVAGPSLAAVGDPLGVTLPTTGPFRTRGSLQKDGDVWKADFDEATIGDSRLQGSFTFDRQPAIPLLSGRLGGRLVLADLGPAIGAHTGGGARPPATPAAAAASAPRKSEGGTGKVLPDRRFDLPSLSAMNADVAIDIAYLDLGTSLLEPLKPLRTHLRLQGGVLTLEDIDARTAEGRLNGSLKLDGRNKERALWNADLRLLGVRLDRWLHQARKNDAPPYISGFMDGQVKVSGAGRSTAEILGSLDGTMRFHLRNASVSHLAVEAAGIDAAQLIGVLFKGDDALAIHCNVIDFAVEKGNAKPEVFVLDTRDSTIWITGSLSLRTEALDLTAVVSPKDFSPLTLRTPVHVKGTFSDPSVSLEKGTVGAKVGAAALLALLNPIAAVIPFIDPGASEDAKREAEQCRALAQRGNAAKSPPAKAPPKRP